MPEYVPSLNILIAEDDDAAAHLMVTNLKRTGIEATFIRAKDGEEADAFLKNPEQASPAFSFKDKVVVLLDIRMPKMDGVQVLQFIKQSDYFKILPVIMFTTSNRDVEIRRCYENGCNFYLKKEVDYQKFSEKISILSAYLQNAELPVLEETENV